MLAVAVGPGLRYLVSILRRSTKGSNERNWTHRCLPRRMGADPLFCRRTALLCRQHDGPDLLLAHGRGQWHDHRNGEPDGTAVVAEAAVEPLSGDVQNEEILRRTDAVCWRSEPRNACTLPALARLFSLQHRFLHSRCLLLVDPRHRG